MATLTPAQVRSLLTPPATPCVSVYFPLAHGALDNPAKFAGLVRRAGEKLDAGKHPALLGRFEKLAEDEEFWSGDLGHAVAAFAAGDFFTTFRLPRAVPERVVVADSFHIKPLLRITQSAERFQVLGLTRTEATLFEGDRYHLRRVKTAGLVPTFDDVVGTELTQTDREQNTRGGRTASTGHYGGHGGRKDELGTDTERFFRAVAKAVAEHVSKPGGLPLVLCCLPEHGTEFRHLSHNPHLLPEGIAHDPGSRSADQLRAEAWEVVQPKYLARLARLTEDFGTAVARNLASHAPDQVAKAAAEGRVGVLLADADRELPTPDGDDQIDDLAEAVLKHGGDVVIVPSDKMPTQTGVAAIFRF